MDDRRVIDGIFHILRTGAPWRNLPERYGPQTKVYNRYNRWAKAGVRLRVFEEPIEAGTAKYRERCDPDEGSGSQRSFRCIRQSVTPECSASELPTGWLSA